MKDYVICYRNRLEGRWVNQIYVDIKAKSLRDAKFIAKSMLNNDAYKWLDSVYEKKPAQNAH